MRLRFLFAMLIFLFAISLSEGCSQPSYHNNEKTDTPRFGGELRTSLSAPVQTLDPAHFFDNASIEVGKEIFAGLITVDPVTGKLAPAHAEGWESTDDKVFDFYLTKGAKFHNGREVTAEDFKYSFERILNPDTASEISGMLLDIKGAKERLGGIINAVEGIRVKDKYHLQIELNKPSSGFLYILTHPGFSVVDKSVVEKAGADFGTQAAPKSIVGSGPFKLVSWNNSQATIKGNPDCFLGKPYLDKVVFRFIKEESTALNEFRAGNLHIVDRLPPGQLRAIKKEFPGQVKTQNLLGLTMYLFNFEKAPLNNRDIRKAVNYAINREDIVFALEGDAVIGRDFIPDGIPGYSDDLGYNYDKDKALMHLEAAGYPGGKGLAEIELKFNASEINQRVAEIIQANLRDVGIKVKLISMEPAAFLEDLGKGNTQMFRISWIADYPDVQTFLAPLFSSAQIGNTNFANYANPDFDRLLGAAQTTQDKSERARLYRQAHQILIEDCAGVVIFYPARTILHSSRVKNLTITEMDVKPLHKVWLAE